jgi:hypothetical protein
MASLECGPCQAAGGRSMVPVLFGEQAHEFIVGREIFSGFLPIVVTKKSGEELSPACFWYEENTCNKNCAGQCQA